MANPKQTSRPIARKAAQQLRNPETNAKYRPIDATAVAQARGKGAKKK